jgi:hypothetical protein
MFKRSILYFLGLIQIVLFLAAAVKPAHAYVDPGSGLLFFQMGGSMLAGALFVLRAKLRKLFSRGSPAKSQAGLKTGDQGVETGTRA